MYYIIMSSFRTEAVDSLIQSFSQIHPQFMVLNIFVDDSSGLKDVYEGAAIIHNNNMIEDSYYNSGFDLFTPFSHSFVRGKVNKLDFLVKCSSFIYTGIAGAGSTWGNTGNTGGTGGTGGSSPVGATAGATAGNTVGATAGATAGPSNSTVGSSAGATAGNTGPIGSTGGSTGGSTATWIKTGIPCGYYMYPRSSLSKTPLRLANSVGIIDSGYRGHLIGMFDSIREKEEEYEVPEYTRLLQVCAPNLMPILVNIVDSEEQLGEKTKRGGGGFGSTSSVAPLPNPPVRPWGFPARNVQWGGQQES